MHHLKGDYGAALQCVLKRSAAAAFAYVEAALHGLRGCPRVPPARAPAFWAALVAAMGALVQVLQCTIPLIWPTAAYTSSLRGAEYL